MYHNKIWEIVVNLQYATKEPLIKNINNCSPNHSALF